MPQMYYQHFLYVFCTHTQTHTTTPVYQHHFTTPSYVTFRQDERLRVRLYVCLSVCLSLLGMNEDFLLCQHRTARKDVLDCKCWSMYVCLATVLYTTAHYPSSFPFAPHTNRHLHAAAFGFFRELAETFRDDSDVRVRLRHIYLLLLSLSLPLPLLHLYGWQRNLYRNYI